MFGVIVDRWCAALAVFPEAPGFTGIPGFMAACIAV
jgi:hypothetical protein